MSNGQRERERERSIDTQRTTATLDRAMQSVARVKKNCIAMFETYLRAFVCKLFNSWTDSVVNAKRLEDLSL